MMSRRMRSNQSPSSESKVSIGINRQRKTGSGSQDKPKSQWKLSFRCQKCCRYFRSESELLAHSKDHKNRMSSVYSCMSCGIIRYSFFQLQLHKLVHTKEEKELQCHVCRKTLKSRQAFKHHTTSQHGAEPKPVLPCQYCNKGFKHLGALKLHESTHDEERKYECTVCNVKVAYIRINQHMRKHIRSPPKPNKFHESVEEESKLQRRSTNYKREAPLLDTTLTGKPPTSTVPRQSPELVCMRGSEVAESNNQHPNHAKLPIGAYANEFKCKSCGKEFQYKRQFNIHLETHSKPYACKLCLKKFGSRFGLQVHIKFHLQIKLSQCKTCYREFVLNQEMLIHQKRHLTQNPILCEHCPASFKTVELLLEHTVDHMGFMKKCVYCEEEFPLRTKLVEHQKKAHPEFNDWSKCPACNEFIIGRKAFKHHILTHLNDCIDFAPA